MQERSEACYQHKIEQQKQPEYTQEMLQYSDDQLALKITGERGSKFKFDEHKWSPTEPLGEGIATTASGNEYHIFNRRQVTYIVNTNESEKQGRLVAAHSPNGTLPPIEFGRPWNLGRFSRTSDVKSVLLRYKVASPGHAVGNEIDTPNPFDKHQRLLERLAPKSS